jgi:protein TonB
MERSSPTGGSFLGAVAESRPRRGRALLVSLVVHAVLLAVAVVLSFGASAASETDPVVLTFFDPPAAAPEPVLEPGGGGAPEAVPDVVPDDPVPEPPRERRPRTPLTYEDPEAEEETEDVFDPGDVFDGMAPEGSGGTGGSGTGTGGGDGSGMGTGTGAGTGAGAGGVRPIYLPAGMQRPRRLRGGDPQYTEVARQARVEGDVVLRIEIDETGTVRDVVVLTGIPLLDEEVVRTVRRWRFTPTIVEGRPVPIYLIQRVTFEL